MRTVICHKFVDVVYVLGIRIGFEMTRQHMTGLLKNFFVCFNPVNDAMQSSIPNSPETLRSVKSNGRFLLNMYRVSVRIMVFSATFNNISVLLVEETGVHQKVNCHKSLTNFIT
jgi:hypothetical protein